MIPLSACSDEGDMYEYDEYDDADYYDDEMFAEPSDYSDADKAAVYGYTMQLDESGKLSISRDDIGSVPMGADGTWTIFVYLCGTDLESDGGYATYDMEEMLAASTGSNVKFVIQTGGTYFWQNDVIASESINRYEICGGEITLVDEQADASMGSADTLSGFLKWGLQNYPAAKMGLVLWNHDGCWFSLPDGQMLAVYIVDECDGYDIYTSPIELNGEETNLRITHDYVNDTVTIDGIWDGIDENGMAARNVYEIKEGDRITPMYYVMEVESDDDGYFYGNEYVFDGEPEIYFGQLDDGEYFYGFTIDDIYGDYLITEYVNFTIDGEDIYVTE